MGLNQIKFTATVSLSVTPPWLFSSVLVDQFVLTLNKTQALKNIDNIAGMVEDRLKTTYKSFTPAFTDGSKDPRTGRTGFAVTIPSFGYEVKRRSSDHLSVYTVETLAILAALQWVEEVQISKVIICSDSSSTLLSLQSLTSNSRQDLINEIHEALFRLNHMGILVAFMWVPAHRGVKGNEAADKLAKQALECQNKKDILFSKSEAKSLIKINIIKEWQHSWEAGGTGRHLYTIQKDVNKGRTTIFSTREENILSRLRIGHTKLNKTMQLIKKHPTGLCEYCKTAETVDHVMWHCQKFRNERGRLKRRLAVGGVQLRDALSLGAGRVLQYLKETGLNKRI